MNNNCNTISAHSIQTLLDALQQAQFTMWAIAQCLNATADEITDAVKNSGLNIIFDDIPTVKKDS